MKLEDIGFYTLSDYRAGQASATSPMWRCEMVLTGRCNLRCVYCRALREDCRGDMPVDLARSVLDLWIADGLKNVRFTGGEPTLYPALRELVWQCSTGGVQRIAVSTNGTASLKTYDKLLDAGVDDFSVSLDGGCCAVGDAMAGNVNGAWNRAVEAIRHLAERAYVTVGVVFTDQNSEAVRGTIQFCRELGVADIRVIPAAQCGPGLQAMHDTSDAELADLPVLRYRINNARKGRPIRGLQEPSPHNCWLAMDDSAVAGRWHFPCIIYLREGGDPIGEIGDGMRAERVQWAHEHDPWGDPICRGMCLDVCQDYNRKYEWLEERDA